jgi:16S rRNA (cytidine1402-2'-O)-methyltransferase
MLYIVATPIGNLKDMTFRAVETLKMVDLIAAEDTRHTRILTQHYQIATPITSYFEHNEVKKAAHLLEQLKAGRSIALVSDAGTPGISDPGYRLIKLAHDHQIPVTVIPGACALTAALAVSGMPSDSFVFLGFLPVKPAGRRNKLAELREETRTVICYESVHRLCKSLQDIRDVLGDPFVVVARELTKSFEEVRRGLCHELLAHFSAVKPKGEFVILINKKESLLQGYKDDDGAGGFTVEAAVKRFQGFSDDAAKGFL